MPSATAVANFFVELGVSEGCPVTQLKLQKLVYYSYAWFIAKHGHALFEQEIEAWKHGPVVRSVWQAFNKYKSDPISEPATSLESVAGKLRFVIPNVDDEHVEFLRAIWNTYAKYSAIQLSNMTHAADEPWAAIRAFANTVDDHPVIPPGLIQNSFGRKLGAS